MRACPICHGAVRDADCIATADRAEHNVCPLRDPCVTTQPQAWPSAGRDDDDSHATAAPEPIGHAGA